jgi:exonuclease VII small subunit
MSSAENNAGVPTDAPTWDERVEYFRMQRWFRFLVLLVIGIWVGLVAWVFFFAPILEADFSPLEASANLTVVLAPILAAAAAVERTLETIFNVLEGSWRTMVAYLGRGMRWLKSAETEVKQARQFLADVADRFNAEMGNMDIGQASVSQITADVKARIDAVSAMMTVAQQRLEVAEDKLSEATSSEGYINAKTAVSVVLGLMLGVIIAALAQLQMFAMLGVDIVPARFDVLITGLVIGSGSYPVHSLVGILQQGKDTLDSVKGYFNRSAPAAQAVEQKITTVQPSIVPGEPPRVQQAVIETTTAKTTEESPNK